jgi:hypothetical protein
MTKKKGTSVGVGGGMPSLVFCFLKANLKEKKEESVLGNKKKIARFPRPHDNGDERESKK